MGSCSSKVQPVYLLPPKSGTSSRTISYDHNDIIGHVYKRDRLANSIKSEFDTYKRHLRGIEQAIKTNTHILFTEFFYDRQELIKSRFKKLIEEMRRIDVQYIKIYETGFQDFEKAYRGYILHLYITDKLTIDDPLLQREEVRAFFGIRKRMVSFSNKTRVIVIPRDEVEAESLPKPS